MVEEQVEETLLSDGLDFLRVKNKVASENEARGSRPYSLRGVANL